MSQDLEIVSKDHMHEDSAAQSSADNRFSDDSSRWPENAVWTRCLGGLDCLQFRYFQRPSNEHLVPAFQMSFPGRDYRSRLSPQQYSVSPPKHVEDAKEASVSSGGNAIDAETFGVPSHVQDKVLPRPRFVQPGAPVGSFLSHNRDGQRQRSEVAENECAIM